MKDMNIKPLKDRMDVSTNIVLRKRYLAQVVSEIIETLKLHFFGIDILMALEVDFDALHKELHDLVMERAEDPVQIIILALSSNLIEQEIFEAKVFCRVDRFQWNSFSETLMCFSARTKNPIGFLAVESMKDLSEMATWIHKKLCLDF